MRLELHDLDELLSELARKRAQQYSISLDAEAGTYIYNSNMDGGVLEILDGLHSERQQRFDLYKKLKLIGKPLIIESKETIQSIENKIDNI